MRFRLACLLALAGACAGPPEAIEDRYPPVRLRLLTDAQHANAIRDLVGDVELPEVRTPGVAVDQFVHEAALFEIRGPLLSQYHAAARVAAAQAVDQLDQLVSCAPATADAECARAFIDRFAARAFRRPLDGFDRGRLFELYQLGAEDGFAGGIELVVEAVLASPDFLYRKELGFPGGDSAVVELTPHEIAAQLSFLFLDSIPDEPLWAAAVDGSLARPEVIAEQVDRLLEIPRVRRHVEEVVLTWLGLPRARLAISGVAGLTPELRASMVAETEAFVADTLWRRDGSLETLLTSSRSFIDARLASHYGIEGVTSSELVAVDLDPDQRAGVLTHAGMLAMLGAGKRRSIVHRGLFVNRLLVCHPEPPPPAIELLEEAREKDGIDDLEERELVDYRAAHPECAGCHQRIDPLGVALEHYDVLGRWRPEARASATITLGDRSIEVTGAVALARQLAESDAVAACVAEQFTQHAFGGSLLEAPLFHRFLLRRFFAADLDLVELLQAMAVSAALRKREREVAR